MMTILLAVTATRMMEAMMDVPDEAMRVIENIAGVEVEEVAEMISVTVRWKRWVGRERKIPLLTSQ
jgi:hypothetical protein